MFYFHPYLGKVPILTNIFQMGWNHQLVFYFLPWDSSPLNHHLENTFFPTTKQANLSIARTLHNYSRWPWQESLDGGWFQGTSHGKVFFWNETSLESWFWVVISQIFFQMGWNHQWWPKWLVNGGYELLTNWNDPPSRQLIGFFTSNLMDGTNVTFFHHLKGDACRQRWRGERFWVRRMKQNSHGDSFRVS